MGEAKRARSATQKLIEKFPDCCFCAGLRATTTREHMPPKSLFDGSHRPDRMVMPACKECNCGTTTADLTAAIVSRWNYDSIPQERADHARLVARARRQAPALIAEWTSLDDIGINKARRHLASHGLAIPQDAGVALIGPHTIRQLNLFAHKAMLALHFEHFQTPLPDVGRFCAFWRSKEDIAIAGIPQFFFDLLPEYGTLVQGRWNESETFEYRHAMNRAEGLFGCLARFRRGLFVFGFSALDSTMLPPDDADWVRPSLLLTLLHDPRFEAKH